MNILSKIAIFIVSVLTLFGGSADVYTGEIVLDTEGKDVLDTSKLVYYTDHPSGVKTLLSKIFR